MLFRGQPKNDAMRVRRGAVEDARVALNGAWRGAAATGHHRGTSVVQTSALEDDDGNVMSLHGFMLGVDELGAPDAQLIVQGNVIDYEG
jgi:hypothetical protein